MTTPPLPADDDHAALAAVASHGGALCTVVGIDGSWSRRLGAQLAVLPDDALDGTPNGAPNGAMIGSLADGCLERALAEEARQGGPARLLRYGAGSPFLDIRLPCGSGVDVVIDPTPDPAAIAQAAQALARRTPAQLPIGAFTRHYLPRLRLLIMGSGPETTALARLARAQGIETLLATPLGEDRRGENSENRAPGPIPLSLAQPPALPTGWSPDAWTAIAILFHDHEWERSLIPWALSTPAFYVGAQGGAKARHNRLTHLASLGLPPATTARLRSPIGLIPAARTPSVLALSVLADVVGAYEALTPPR